MPKFFCPRHAGSPPCSCSMGNLYRYIEPAVLLVLKEEQKSYGYDLAEKLTNFALTDARIERASLYRTLRVLEENGHVTSTWDVEGSGPARRVYALTKKAVAICRSGRNCCDGRGRPWLRFPSALKREWAMERQHRSHRIALGTLGPARQR